MPISEISVVFALEKVRGVPPAALFDYEPQLTTPERFECYEIRTPVTYNAGHRLAVEFGTRIN